MRRSKKLHRRLEKVLRWLDSNLDHLNKLRQRQERRYEQIDDLECDRERVLEEASLLIRMLYPDSGRARP